MNPCRFLHRNNEYCDAEPIVVIPYGMDHVGACSKHVGPVILWTMNNSRTMLPSRPVAVIPAHRWDDFPSLHDGI